MTDQPTTIYPSWQKSIRAAQAQQAAAKAEAEGLETEKKAAEEKVIGMALRRVLQRLLETDIPELKGNLWVSDGFEFFLQPMSNRANSYLIETDALLEFNLVFAAVFPDSIPSYLQPANMSDRVRGRYVTDEDWSKSRAYLADKLDAMGAVRDRFLAERNQPQDSEGAAKAAADYIQSNEPTPGDLVVSAIRALIEEAWGKHRGEL